MPPAPIVELTLAGFAIELNVDTGFGGGILIPFSLFQSLGLLSTLGPDTFHAVMPDSRRIRLYTARTDVSLRSFKFQVNVHSSPLLEKKLLGRMFLQMFVVILDGPKKEMKLHSSSM